MASLFLWRQPCKGAEQAIPLRQHKRRCGKWLPVPAPILEIAFNAHRAQQEPSYIDARRPGLEPVCQRSNATGSSDACADRRVRARPAKGRRTARRVTRCETRRWRCRRRPTDALLGRCARPGREREVTAEPAKRVAGVGRPRRRSCGRIRCLLYSAKTRFAEQYEPFCTLPRLTGRGISGARSTLRCRIERLPALT